MWLSADFSQAAASCIHRTWPVWAYTGGASQVVPIQEPIMPIRETMGERARRVSCDTPARASGHELTSECSQLIT